MKNSLRRLSLAFILAIMAILPAAANEPEELSFDGLLKQIESYRRPIVVDVYTTWCGPCRRFAPIYAEAAESWAGTASFYRMDLDANSQLSEMLGIRSIPTLLVLYVAEGKLQCAQNTGFLDAGDLDTFLRQSLAGADGSDLNL